MQRKSVAPRPNQAQVALDHGFELDQVGGVLYWDERAYYRFTLRQIEDHIEGPGNEIEAMCHQLLERAVRDEAVFRRLQIPESYWDYVAESWRRREKDLYGRMDFSYDGAGDAKLLEYNADTPTTLYESTEFQWLWLEQASALGLIPKDCDQFNEIYEDLLAAFADLGLEGLLHLACIEDMEDDKGTVDYLGECARDAGLETRFIAMKDIGVDAQGRFSDLEDEVISTLFKLYPWEWIMGEEFARHLVTSDVHFLEPPWKAVLANKGMLPFLWDMFEGHPNLLPSYFEDDPRAADLSPDFVRKPLLSRQGWNVEIHGQEDVVLRRDGPYGDEGHIIQAFNPLPEFNGAYPLVGCWMVAGRSAGLCIREDQSLVTTPDARFVPHVILD
jgi:glutathionylspermidine synthase